MPIRSDPPPDLTFADVARAYVDRHIRRYLVPRAAQLAQYADAFLATVEVPAPTGGTMAFPDKPFRLITTDDVEQATSRRRGPARRPCAVREAPPGLAEWAGARPPTGSMPICAASGGGRSRKAMPRPRRLRGRGCPPYACGRSTPANGAWWGMIGARLLAACRPHLRDVVTAALETGCRKQELLSLQWAQVHWERNELVLPGTKTKTKRPRRIPISAALHAILMARWTRATGEAYGPRDYVFGKEDGSRVRDIKTAWTASCRRAGIKGLRFHDLRHEAGSRKLEAGYPVHAVSLWLGHTTLTTTARYLNADIGQLHALNDRPVPPAIRAAV